MIQKCTLICCILSLVKHFIWQILFTPNLDPESQNVPSIILGKQCIHYYTSDYNVSVKSSSFITVSQITRCTLLVGRAHNN